MNKIYFDHAATTPVDEKVLAAMLPYFKDNFGNASSMHSFGQEALKAVDKAREQTAEFLGCSPEEIIFTSGATEADNLAIFGICHPELVSGSLRKEKIPHLITTAFEHPAVLETCKYLEKNNLAEVSYVKPNTKGLIQIADIEKEIKDNTVLISVIYVNNEIGTIQPVKEIGEMIKEIKKLRNKEIKDAENKIYPLYFHTDAVQATLYCDLNVKNLGVDLMSISGHKIYGPKGIGVLYVKKDTPLKNIHHGGHQEFGLRPGTLNTPLIVGLGEAAALIKERDIKKIKLLRDYLWQKIQENISGVVINGDLENSVPSHLNISIDNVEGEALLLGLDLAGIAVSTGSACSSGSLEPSPVLMALGLSHEQAHGSLRITLGEENTKEEIDYFVAQLKILVAKLRAMAPK